MNEKEYKITPQLHLYFKHEKEKIVPANELTERVARNSCFPKVLNDEFYQHIVEANKPNVVFHLDE